MSQPNLSIKNSELAINFKSELTIHAGHVASATVIVAIGEEVISRRDNNAYVPLLIAQRRADISNSPSTLSQAAVNFFGVGSRSRILRKIQNATPEAIAAQGIEVGTVIDGANIVLDRAVSPFYTRADGRPQDPMMNPETMQTLTVEGQPVYENTRIEFGPAEHTGLDIQFDKTEVAEVEAETATVEADLELDF